MQTALNKSVLIAGDFPNSAYLCRNLEILRQSANSVTRLKITQRAENCVLWWFFDSNDCNEYSIFQYCSNYCLLS